MLVHQQRQPQPDAQLEHVRDQHDDDGVADRRPEGGGAGEVERLRTIGKVVRKGRVEAIEPDRMVLRQGEEQVAPGTLFIDCTARAVPFTAEENSGPQFRGEAHRLCDASDLLDRIYRAARDLFQPEVSKGPFRLIGVGIADLAPEAEADLLGDLLDPDAQRRAKAERARDAIRAKFGPDAIVKGRSLR